MKIYVFTIYDNRPGVGPLDSHCVDALAKSKREANEIIREFLKSKPGRSFHFRESRKIEKGIFEIKREW